MNKQLDDLLYQAGLTAQGCWDELGTYEQEAIERLMELMTHEFIGILKYEINLCEKYKDTACNDFDRKWQQGKIEHFHKLIDKTKDHFGVEE